MDVHMRFGMLIYNNFEITNESTDILTYIDIMRVYVHSGLFEYYNSFFYTITDKNLKIIIDNLLKDYYKKNRNVFVGLKIKDCISKYYGLNGEDYLKQVVDDTIIRTSNVIFFTKKSSQGKKQHSSVKIDTLYNIVCSNIFFNTDNIYLTSYLSKSRFISKLKENNDIYENYKHYNNTIVNYKMR